MHGRRDTELISLVTLSLVTKNLSRCHNNGDRGHLQGSDNYLYRIKLCLVVCNMSQCRCDGSVMTAVTTLSHPQVRLCPEEIASLCEQQLIYNFCCLSNK